MSIFEYNGSALVAMVGKIASPLPVIVASVFSSKPSPLTFSEFPKFTISCINDWFFPQVIRATIGFSHKLYELREERNMKPETFANLVSVILYEKRFGPYFCQPVVAGLGEDDKPYICTMDSIGAKNQRSYLRQFLKHCNQQLIVIAWLVGEDMSLSFCLYAKAPDDHPCSKLCADVKLGTAQRVLDSNLQSLDHELRYSKS